VDSGNWYFDLSNKSLVYVVNNSQHLHTAQGELNKIRFQVKLVKETTGSGSTSTPVNNARNVVGVILEPVLPYKWF